MTRVEQIVLSLAMSLRLGCQSGTVTCSVKSLDLPAAILCRPSSTTLIAKEKHKMFNRHFKNHCIISPSGTSTTLSKSLPLKSTTTQLLAQVGGAAALVRTPRPPHVLPLLPAGPAVHSPTSPPPAAHTHITPSPPPPSPLYHHNTLS
ncbi:hypothetical protein Pmani_029565 [Petrolisthes manimaculis]|uniref:Uncharacterized protein n=1 Tax=Petrolisthes manimaculis TaxID=1843537 RepID=A0AAE1TUC0_9EUCA|nr:hypothetical protein Pmani_029565 [Petrolisthes manimaculis]